LLTSLIMRTPRCFLITAVAALAVASGRASAAPTAPEPNEAPAPYEPPPSPVVGSRPQAPPPIVAPSLTPPPSADRSEAGLAAGQLALGILASSAVTTGGLYLFARAFVDGGDSAAPGLALLLLAPGATGAAICAVGSTSRTFRGHCGAAIGAAYLGALSVIPFGYLGGAVGKSDGALIGILVGWVVGSAAGGVLGWNASRQPLDAGPPPAAPARDDDTTASRARSPFAPSSRPALALPLLALQF
jgi:hypothetical protein